MPKIDDKDVGVEFVEYGSKNDGASLAMILRWKAVSAALTRLALDKETLEFDIKVQQDRLWNLRSRPKQRKTEKIKCHFCREAISNKALVCSKCLRVQPLAYSKVIEMDKLVSAALENSDQTHIPQSIAREDQCFYCFSSIKNNALVCPTCKRLQPNKIDEVVKEDMRAITCMQK